MANTTIGACLYPTLPIHLSTSHDLEAVPPFIQIYASATYDASHKVVTEGLYAPRIRKENTSWKQQDDFCAWLRIPTNLQVIHDPIPFLQIFTHKDRTGILAGNHQTIHKQSMDQYIHSEGNIFADVGDPDPIPNTVGSTNFRLGYNFATYKKEGPPS